jgi:hypothetical protein
LCTLHLVETQKFSFELEITGEQLMKLPIRFSIALTIISLVGFCALTMKTEAKKSVAVQSGPVILKRTIKVNAKRFSRWWKNPKAAEPVYNTYCWVPIINFQALGPIQGGSQFYVEFDTADGKPWVKYNMTTPETDIDTLEDIKMKDVNDEEMEKKAITTAGVFPFRIKLKNALEGKDDVVFAGKYKVGTYAPNQAIPDYKGKLEFFVDHDWTLPIGYIWLNPINNEDAPPLAVQVWMKGATDRSKMQAFVFYNGKQIKMNTVAGNPVSEIYSAADEPPFRYTLWEFSAPTIRGFNNDQSNNTYPDVHWLNKNPGEYEIKVLRDNQLARVGTFTVGQDGKIVDNGFARNAKFGGVRMILPLKIVGAGDGKWNMTAWQTDAFYGNPLSGFVAP